MSSLKNSQFGKRLRALRGTGDENSPSRKRRRLNLNPSSPTTSPKKKSRALSTAVLDVTNTPTKRRKTRCSTLGEDRFVLSRDHSDLWASYSLDEQVHHPSPSVKPTVRRWSLPNPIKERADELFKSVLRSASSPIASHPLSRTSQSENSPTSLKCPKCYIMLQRS